MLTRYLLFVVIILLTAQTGQSQSGNQSILFFGDSITAGYGIEQDQAFPALIQQKIDSLGWNFSVRNGGLSGETSAGGVRRIDWMLQKEVDVFVLELGGNDGLRGIDMKSTEQNLQEIIDKVQKKYPDAAIILAGMQVPPNLGNEYTRQFKNIYPRLSQSNGIPLIPALMENVGGKSNLMQADGLHPTVRGHKLIADTIWKTLKPILRERKK